MNKSMDNDQMLYKKPSSTCPRKGEVKECDQLQVSEVAFSPREACPIT